MTRRGILLVCALAGCGKEGGFPRDALPLRPVAGDPNVATLIQGSWTTITLASDSVSTGTEVDLRDGVAEERSIYKGMGEPERRTVVGHGRYTLFGNHEIQIEMSGENPWRERFTFWHRTHHFTPPKPAGEHLLYDVYLATATPSTFARRWWRATKKGVEGLDVELGLSPNVDALVRGPGACTGRIAILASARGRSTTETRSFKCHVGPTHPTGLVQLVIDDLPPPTSLSRPTKDPEADNAIGGLVAYAIDRELYLDPAHPEAVIRGTALETGLRPWHR